METIIIDLKKNPDIADITKTMQPGDPLDLHTSIKAKDDQTLAVTVRQASEGKPFEDDEEEEQEEPGDSTQPPPGATEDGAQAGAGPDAMGMTGGEVSAT